MDKIAIISDIHGNMHALETVLGDIQNRGIEIIYNLGDIAGKGPYSAEVVDCCRELCDVTVRGNWDTALDDMQYTGAEITFYRNQLGSERLAYLASLPNSYDFVMSGYNIRLFHASHINEFHRIYPFETYDVYAAMFTNTDFTGHDMPQPDVVGYGDVHCTFMQTLHRDHKMLFNAGSVGNPLDIPQASYVVLTGNLDGAQTAPFKIEIVRLPYDIDATIQAGRDVNMPEFDVWEVETRTAVHRSQQNNRS